MKKIRLNSFETNSSSTHSLTVLDREDWNKWDGINFFLYGDKIISREEVIKLLPSDLSIETLISKPLLQGDYEIYTPEGYDEYYFDDNPCIYGFDKTFKTKNGDEVVIFGYHGNFI